jgi:hypothetical protein
MYTFMGGVVKLISSPFTVTASVSSEMGDAEREVKHWVRLIVTTWKAIDGLKKAARRRTSKQSI